mgnify:CR=1 FL=1
MLSVWDNTLAVAYRKLADNILGVINKKKIGRNVNDVCRELDVRMISDFYSVHGKLPRTDLPQPEDRFHQFRPLGAYQAAKA